MLEAENVVAGLKLLRFLRPRPPEVDRLVRFLQPSPTVPEPAIFAHSLEVEWNADVEGPGRELEALGHVVAELPSDSAECGHLLFDGVAVSGNALRSRFLCVANANQRLRRPDLIDPFSWDHVGKRVAIEGPG